MAEMMARLFEMRTTKAQMFWSTATNGDSEDDET